MTGTILERRLIWISAGLKVLLILLSLTMFASMAWDVAHGRQANPGVVAVAGVPALAILQLLAWLTLRYLRVRSQQGSAR